MRLVVLAPLAAAVAWITLAAGPPGVGVVVVAALVAAATLPQSPMSALAFVLACSTVLRDAGWVVGADLAASVVFGAIAVTNAVRIEQLVAAPLALVARFVDVPVLAAQVEVDHARLRRRAPILRGALTGGLLVLPFGALFWTADAAFARLGGAVPFPDPSTLLGRTAAAIGVLALCGGLALAARRPPDGRLPSLRRSSAADWAIPLVLLDLLFLAFVLVQLTVLFGGHDHVLETRGLTYAEYARHGYAQLLVAAALALIVVGVAARVAAPRHRGLLRALTAVLCLLTLVVVASALKRLDLYEDAYGFTRLRVAANAAGLWLGVLFALLVLAPRVRPRAVAGLAGVALAAFTLANPDRLVARWNIDRWERTGRLDVPVLSGLSADAVPELVRLPPELRGRALSRLEPALRREEPWSSANLARAKARDLLDKQAARVG